MTLPVLDPTPEQLAYQAKEVQLLLAHDGWKRAIASTEERIKREWERGETPEHRERIFQKLEAWKTLKRELQAFAERRPLTITQEE